MWKHLLQLAKNVEANSLSKTKRNPKATKSEVVLAGDLQRMGKSLDLVCRMIVEDRSSPDGPMVVSVDRTTAADLISVLCTDSSQRKAYQSFLEIAAPTFRYDFDPDERTTNFIIQRRWSQLSSNMLGKLLLNPKAIHYISRRLATDPPEVWQEWRSPFNLESKAPTRSRDSSSPRSRRKPQ